MTTYTTFLARVALLRPLRGKMGRRLVATVGLLFNYLAEGYRQSVRAPWIGDSVGPAHDALGPAGNELSLPRYPNETWTQYQARLERAWDDWQSAGHESSIIAQLAAAGFPGAEVYGPLQWPTRPPSPWWSQLWVLFPAGAHTVTAPSPIVGSFTVGDGSVIGVVGLSLVDLATMRAIIKKFKPGHYVARQIIFEISGWTIGTGHTVGEVDLLIGGEHAVLGV